jgi:hypothetical protein
MSQKNKVPDAWDDDWVANADVTLPSRYGMAPHTTRLLFCQKPSTPSEEPEAKVSKAERRARQAEFNRKLWAEA